MGLAYKFPTFYGLIDRLFFTSDQNSPLSPLAIENMDIQSISPNAIVIDLACGSGTVALWIAKQRADIHVVGIDSAEDMIAAASNTAKKLGLENVSFTCQSALTINNEALLSISSATEQSASPVQMIVCSYGFSAMENHVKMFEQTANLLASGGRYVIIDLHYSTRNWFSLFMTHCVDNWLWGSNQLKPVWEVMPQKLVNSVKHEQPLKLYHIIPAVFYVAKGIKA